MTGNTLSLKQSKQLIDETREEISLHKSDLVSHGVYGTANGTNTLVMSVNNVITYIEGMLVAFKNTTSNTGTTTLNINGLGAKPIKKSNGSNLTSGNLKAGGVYQVRYDGVNFILLGEGGGEYGNATAADVLTGKTVGTENGLITGTIPNYGRAVLGQGYTNPRSYMADGGGSLVIEPNTGYYEQGLNANNFGSIIMSDPNFIAPNIIQGKSIFGVNGTATAASLGGLRIASGTIHSDGSYNQFYSYKNGSWGYPAYGKIIVTGLTGKPKFIMVNSTSTLTQFAAYYSEMGVATISGAKMEYSDNSDSFAQFATMGAAYSIHETGFTFPVMHQNHQYQWVAIF